MGELLKGKIAIITGAGSGVGRAASRIFAHHGAKVVAADVDEAAAAVTAGLVKEAGGEVIAAACDVASEVAVRKLVAHTVETFGRLDIIYNNAGITIQPRTSRRFTDASQADIDRLYAINVDGVIHGCKAAIRQFEVQGGGGIIVNTASVAGLVAYGNVVYGSTKGAVVALTRGLALEYASQGIRVNSVCPAGMPTNFIEGGAAMSDAARASMSETHPLGRPIEPEDCANAALFLASDLASNITGVNLPVDGGLSAGIPMKR